jgi:hypothetical protein
MWCSACAVPYAGAEDIAAQVLRGITQSSAFNIIQCQPWCTGRNQATLNHLTIP